MSTKVNNQGQMMPPLQTGSTSASRKPSKRKRQMMPPLQTGSTSASRNHIKIKRISISSDDVEHVKNLIEWCVQSHMNKDEAVKTLFTKAKIEPQFTTIVWQLLEKENPDFFKIYYMGLKLEKELSLFNRLIGNEYHRMKCLFPRLVPLAPEQNGIHPMPVNNLPMSYTVLQQPSIPAAGQPHIEYIGGDISSCGVVREVPASSNFHPIQTNSGNGSMVMDHSALDMAPVIPAPTQPHIESIGGGISSCHVVSGVHAPSNFHPIQTNSGNGMMLDHSALDMAPGIAAAGQPHLQSTGADISSCHVFSGVHAPSNFNPIQTNSGNGMVMYHGALNMAPVIPSNGTMSSLLEMPVNPTSVAPEQNGIHPMPVNSLPMSYTVLQQPFIPEAGQPHLESIGGDISSCQVVSEVPVSSNFHPIQTNSGNGIVMMDHSALDMAPVIPSNGAMSPLLEMPVNPTSVPSSDNVPFTASEISRMETDASAPDTVFISDVPSSEGLQLEPDNGTGISGPLDEDPWGFGLSDFPDLTDLPLLGDTEELENYSGSPIMQSNSDILPESSNLNGIGNDQGGLENYDPGSPFNFMNSNSDICWSPHI